LDYIVWEYKKDRKTAVEGVEKKSRERQKSRLKGGQRRRFHYHIAWEEICNFKCVGALGFLIFAARGFVEPLGGDLRKPSSLRDRASLT